MKKIRIIIADYHKLVREVWASYLNSVGVFEVLATTGEADKAVELAILHKPDIILMDTNLDSGSAIEAIQKLKSLGLMTKVIGVSAYSLPAYAKKILHAGAMGYITKNSSSEELIKAIQEVGNGYRFICSEVLEILSEELLEGKEKDPGISQLTERELEIIQLVKVGKSSREIALLLNIALKTVEAHRHSILKKLKLPNTAAVVNFIHSSERYI
jgi:DNA-binding NarL/FixJ family response regulator